MEKATQILCTIVSMHLLYSMRNNSLDQMNGTALELEYERELMYNQIRQGDTTALVKKKKIRGK